MLKSIFQTLTIIFGLLIIVTLNKPANAQSDGQCEIICPGSEATCTYEDAQGNTVWSEKDPDKPAIIRGPCDIVLEN